MAQVNQANTVSYAMLKSVVMSMHEASKALGFWPMRKPILIRGEHGRGKTECVRDLARLMGLELIERRASQLMDGDLLGIPFQVPGPPGFNTNVTEYAAPKWLAEACVRPMMVFLDEVDRATNRSVEQGLFQLADSRCIGDAKLHPGTVVIAAINGGLHDSATNGRYKTVQMDSASLSRWAIFDFHPSTEDWMNWATATGANGKQNVLPVIISFLSSDRKMLDEEMGDIDPNVKTRDRRGWGQLSEALSYASTDGIQWMDNESFKRPGVFPAFQSLCCAFLGTATGTAFAAYAKTYVNRITVDDVEKGRFDKTRVDNISVPDKIGLCESLLAKWHFKAMPDSVADNISVFFNTMDLEIANNAINGLLPGFKHKWVDVTNSDRALVEIQTNNIRKTMTNHQSPMSRIPKAVAASKQKP